TFTTPTLTPQPLCRLMFGGIAQAGRVEDIMMAFQRSPFATATVRFGLGMLAMVLVAATPNTSGADCAGPAFVIGPTSMSPTTIAQGWTGTVQTQMYSGSAADVLIDLEIYDTSNTKLAQRAFPGQSFIPGETKSYEWPYFVDVLRPDGIYTVKTGVFSDDWSVLHQWDNAGTTFIVGAGPDCGGGITEAATGPRALIIPGSPSNHAPVAGTLDIGSRVCVGSAADVLVDFEIYDSAGVRVEHPPTSALFGCFGTSVFPDQHFAAGETKIYHVCYVAGALPRGVYTVKVGVFSTDWSTLFHW